VDGLSEGMPSLILARLLSGCEGRSFPIPQSCEIGTAIRCGYILAKASVATAYLMVYECVKIGSGGEGTKSESGLWV